MKDKRSFILLSKEYALHAKRSTGSFLEFTIYGSASILHFISHIAKVSRVLPAKEMILSTEQPPAIGKIRYHNAIIPVFGFNETMGQVNPKPYQNLVIFYASKSFVAFAVHAVNRIRKIEWSQIIPSSSSNSAQPITGIFQSTERNLLLFDFDALNIHAQNLTSGTEAFAPKVPTSQSAVVAIIDDSPTILRVLSVYLGSQGYEVQTFPSARDFLERSENQQQTIYAAIVVDIELPDTDGFALARSLREEIRYQFTRIIHFTAMASQETRSHSSESGADAIIEKFAFDELVKQIEEAAELSATMASVCNV